MVKSRMMNIVDHRLRVLSVLLMGFIVLGVGLVVRRTPEWIQPDRTGLTFGTVTTPEGGLVLLIATSLVATGFYVILALTRE